MCSLVSNNLDTCTCTTNDEITSFLRDALKNSTKSSMLTVASVFADSTARMIAKSQATVVPIYFDGHNSRLFQLMSHLHSTLRMAFLINEFRARVDEPVKIVVGAPISQDKLDAQSDPT